MRRESLPQAEEAFASPTSATATASSPLIEVLSAAEARDDIRRSLIDAREEQGKAPPCYPAGRSITSRIGPTNGILYGIFNRNQLIALGGAGALVLAAGGYFIGRSAAPAPEDEAAEAEHAEEAEHGPEGFVAMTAERATRGRNCRLNGSTAGGLDSEILAQGAVAPTPAGEAVLTARADGAIVRINRRLGDYVRAGESVATMESREAAALSSERSSAEARLALGSVNL